ncbi:MAG TPA: SRPBCC family protein [Roseiflexaceae bacterium]|nr:SRPBCC family protein [Roseiflexaceae bacterium]
MATNEYHFITRWRLEGRVEEIADIIGDARDLARWWPSVYLEVRELDPGDARGLGKRIDLYTKGWLPYTLRWQFRITEIASNGFTLEATGDFVGRGIWTFEQDGQWAIVTYDWKIRADKPLLRYLSFIMKPIFAANHRWAMAQGERSLKLELARRHAVTPDELARIPAPPGPTTSSSLPLLIGFAATLALAYALLKRR